MDASVACTRVDKKLVKTAAEIEAGLATLMLDLLTRDEEGVDRLSAHL